MGKYLLIPTGGPEPPGVLGLIWGVSKERRAVGQAYIFALRGTTEVHIGNSLVVSVPHSSFPTDWQVVEMLDGWCAGGNVDGWVVVWIVVAFLAILVGGVAGGLTGKYFPGVDRLQAYLV